jgi:hypothetical protein
MAKKTPCKKRKPDTLDSISGTDANKVLRILANRDKQLKIDINVIIKELLADVSLDEVADCVQSQLESLSTLQPISFRHILENGVSIFKSDRHTLTQSVPHGTLSKVGRSSKIKCFLSRIAINKCQSSVRPTWTTEGACTTEAVGGT